MMHQLIAFSIRFRLLVVITAIIVAVAGLRAALQSPLDAVPDLSENQVIVFANWPGHGPTEVEQQLTRPLSLQIQGLPDVRVVRGSSDVGYSMLHVIFADHVTFHQARRRVQEQLASLTTELPNGVVPHLAADGIPTGQIFWYTVEGTGYDLSELRGLQDWTIAPQLRSVPGVAEVASVGGFVAELQIQVDPGHLVHYDLTVSQLVAELSRPTDTVGGHVLHKGQAEYIVQLNVPAVGDQQLANWRARQIPLVNGRSVRLDELARVNWQPAVRRGMFEKDGSEAVAGIVHLRYGHHAMQVTRQVRARLQEIAAGLPPGVRLVPCYDRTPLILGAVGTVSRALLEALIVAAVCVLLVLRHFRAWLVIALTLPLSVLCTFLAMSLLRQFGWLDLQTNIMSLAGMVVSIGVLVDSSIVMTENVMHRLRLQFGDAPVTGDVSSTVQAACQTVGWPVFCSIFVMLISFAPVFALGGIDGRMYQPLAWTKSLALVSAALLAVTVVPALCSYLVRGRIRDESSSWVVRNVISVYRPLLSQLMDAPGPLVALLCLTLILAVIPLANEWLVRGTLFVTLIVTLTTAVIFDRWRRGVLTAIVLVVAALIGQATMRPLGTELRIPLDEGMVMDMPITIPRASIVQSADDLKARNMILCRFPEVSMVTGKAGRAETPFDPAPLDMIESMIEFRPREFWPRRRLLRDDADRMAARLLAEMATEGLITSVPAELRAEIVDATMFRFDGIQRETCFQLSEAFQLRGEHELCRTLIERAVSGGGPRKSQPLTSAELAALVAGIPEPEKQRLMRSPSVENVAAILAHLSSLQDTHESATEASHGAVHLLNSMLSISGWEPATHEEQLLSTVQARWQRQWQSHVYDLDRVLHQRAVPGWLRLVLDECYQRGHVTDPALAAVCSQIHAARTFTAKPHDAQAHHGIAPIADLPFIDPHPKFDAIRQRLTEEFSNSFLLRSHDPDSLSAFGGEMDRVLQMPGWTNVWTKPIQNRVDMLATGVNAEVGVRVLGRNLDEVVQASERIAAVLKTVPGASDVVADPIRGKGLIQITPDTQRAAQRGVDLADLQAVLETSLSGQVVGQLLDGSERKAIRIRCISPSTETDEQSLRQIPVPCSRRTPPGPAHPQTETRSIAVHPTGTPVSHSIPTVPLEQVADVRVTEGPATIKSENGWLRNYVRLNVRDRSPLEFVAAARTLVAQQVRLPAGVFVEWTGQFEHAERTRTSLSLLIPSVVMIIFAMLYFTYRNIADALLMLLSAPGALAGGLLCQWLLGYRFSIAVGVGYIACFGMAAATGIVMLVYLREAIELAGGLKHMSLPELKQAVLDGAVHRLRPKLLTEATTILGLAPMLWSDGTGADVIRPMAAPVLGGILIADEVIDLLIPILFYHVQRWQWLRIHGEPKPAPMNLPHSSV